MKVSTGQINHRAHVINFKFQTSNFKHFYSLIAHYQDESLLDVEEIPLVVYTIEFTTME